MDLLPEKEVYKISGGFRFIHASGSGKWRREEWFPCGSKSELFIQKRRLLLDHAHRSLKVFTGTNILVPHTFIFTLFLLKGHFYYRTFVAQTFVDAWPERPLKMQICNPKSWVLRCLTGSPEWRIWLSSWWWNHLGPGWSSCQGFPLWQIGHH